MFQHCLGKIVPTFPIYITGNRVFVKNDAAHFVYVGTLSEDRVLAVAALPFATTTLPRKSQQRTGDFILAAVARDTASRNVLRALCNTATFPVITQE